MNYTNTTLYIGFTNDLIRRTYEHKNELVDGFSKRYHLHKLVHYEQTNDVHAARQREQQLKNWRRDWKMDLIRERNPELLDLAAGWYEGED